MEVNASNKRRREHIREIESVIDGLGAKLPTVKNVDEDPHRRERVAETIALLEKAAVPARERTARRRTGERRDRQRDRLLQRLRLGTCKFAEALELIESCNPLPGVTGRVCPQEHQRQGVCTLVGKPIEIGQLEWFLPPHLRRRKDENVLAAYVRRREELFK